MEARLEPKMLEVGCELEEKERFWSELDEVMESIPTGERVVIGADFNGHVGEGNTGDEEVMGKFGVKERNLEGQMVVDFAKRMDMGVVNTYFQKREEHRVTYKSGGRRTQVDYILCRRGNLKEISDCKVVVGESVARQHRMVVCRMTLMVCKKKRSEIEKKTKWWKLKKEECCEEFRQKLRQALGGQVVLPDDWETTAEVIRETGRKVLGVSSGRRKEDKETWWWNEEVQDSIQRKRLAKKKWDMDRTEENRQEYKELQRRVKREVSKAKQKAYDELYTRLDTREGEKDLYRLARQRDRDGKDVQQVRVIKDRDGRVLTSEESVQRRWKEYFEELMNEENEREKRVEGVNSVEQKVDKIRKDEVRKALKRMKSGKAVGPDDIPVEVWKCLGEAAVEFLASLFNRVLESERMPEEWRRSVLVPIFKNKGDVQSCSNYRGIKLMSHTMKVWERVVEARLRKVVEICEQQYGFMPRKSTTDAIFALRILMEKYRDGQRELHCVFVDLEKAYDRVPREELWYCMRKSGVAEKYVRVVQDMYERSRTVVRCAVGQTEEFNVEVGLHQGSALSPFLFAIVMDQLSEEVRQESPWTMMFADDIVICSESREQVEENLERWRFALERRGMKVSRSKTEYMCVNEREGSGTVRLQGEEVKKVQEFKYLGSTVQSNGECGKEVKKRVQAGWNGWRKVSGVLCDQKISARIKGKVYRTVVRPAMLYGLETVSLRKRQESELEVAELKMLRFSLGVTRLDRIRNEYIRETAHVGRLGDKVREARLRWFGHVQRRESDTNKPMADDLRDNNLPKKSKRDQQVDEGIDERSQDKVCGLTSSEINQGLKSSQKKHIKRLDTEQPKDTNTRVHNQQKESEKAGASGQSDAERETCDTSDGKRIKFIKVKNKNSEVPNAGDGVRQRSSNKKENIAHLGKGDIPGRVVKTKRSPVADDTSSSHRGWYILLAILFSLLTVVVLFGRTPSPPKTNGFNFLEVFYQEMDKVKDSFPSQHSELWRRSRIHLQKHLNLTDPTEPVSLILTSGRVAEKTLGCLAQRLATAFSNVFNSSVLGIDGTSKSAQDSDQVKMDIDKTLKEAFNGGTKAAVIHRFEELPSGSTLIFYRYCDHENSAFKKVFLAFTVMLEEEVAFPPNVSLGMVEEMVQEYLKRKFVSSNRTAKFNQMDLDKLSGLWSRISHLILPVAPEQKIEQQGCQT
ncbi:hypothetical protein QTP86_032350 [Hemibagrus guttatus]|nr:hypothetical protein QTP86_032350 [Hemibagrus guttatus]